MQYFCTLFDSYYLNRGLVMYDSLKRHSPAFHLYIFAFDNIALDILRELELESVTIISLSEFENDNLLRIKPTRSKSEYCWTCTPSTIDFCLTHYNIDHCTYLDADLCFYNDPAVLTDEMGDKSVLITEHRYAKGHDQAATSGIYCVQFVTFKKTVEGLVALQWWRDRCIEWCYNRMEDGKFGDQKYLDDWTTRFQGVHVLTHLGGGVAPWNVQQYVIFQENDSWKVKDRQTGKIWPLVFYHYHYVKLMDDGTANLSRIYNLRYAGLITLYKDYLRNILDLNEMLASKFNWNAPVETEAKRSILYRLARRLYRPIKKMVGVHNVIDLRKLK